MIREQDALPRKATEHIEACKNLNRYEKGGEIILIIE